MTELRAVLRRFAAHQARGHRAAEDLRSKQAAAVREHERLTGAGIRPIGPGAEDRLARAERVALTLQRACDTADERLTAAEAVIGVLALRLTQARDEVTRPRPPGPPAPSRASPPRASPAGPVLPPLPPAQPIVRPPPRPPDDDPVRGGWTPPPK